MLGVVLLSLLALILLILFLSVSICVVYEGDVSVFVKVLFLQFKVFPRNSKINLKDFSAKGINKKLRKDKQVLAKHATKEEKKKTKSSKKRKTNIIDTLKLVADILSAIKVKFFKYLRVKLAKLGLVLATDDAAKTAIEYGIAVQGVQYIVSILEGITNFSVEKSGYIHVDCDFTSEKTSLDLDITLSLRVWQMIAILIRAGLEFVINSGKKKIEN